MRLITRCTGIYDNNNDNDNNINNTVIYVTATRGEIEINDGRVPRGPVWFFDRALALNNLQARIRTLARCQGQICGEGVRAKEQSFFPRYCFLFYSTVQFSFFVM